MKNLFVQLRRYARTGETAAGWPAWGKLCPRCREPMVLGEKRVKDKDHTKLDGTVVVHRRCSDGTHAQPWRAWVDSLTPAESAEYFGEAGWSD